MFQRILSLLLVFAGCVSAARAYDVRALVTDSVGEPLPYVTYRIFGTDSLRPAAAGLSDIDGIVCATLPAAGTYRMALSYTGMADATRSFDVADTTPSADLGDITLSESARTLQGITVTAQRPLVVKQIDRLGYDVQADPDTPTAQVSDILRKVPTVSVDADGTIKVNGSTDFKIYKNGRPNNALSRNSKEIFAAMPASTIKRIEVITDPGAAYDAEGTSAILNIVTNDTSAMKGVLGTAQIRYTNMNDYPEASLFLTSEIDKVTFSANAGYAHLGGRMVRQNSSSVTHYPSGVDRTETTESDLDGDIVFFGLDSSWQPDTLNLFTAEVNGYHFNSSPFGTTTAVSTDAAGSVLGTLASRYHNPFNRYFDISANFNFQHNTRRKGEVYTFSYLLSHTNESNNNKSEYTDATGIDMLPYTGIIARYKLNFIEHTFQADWTRTLGIHNIDAGAKAIIRRNRSNNHFDYTGWQQSDTEFSHITDIGALYAQYSVQLRRVNLRAGMRWEYSHLKASYPDGSGRDYTANLSDWVPSAAASWQVNDANSLTANFSTSISRPGISYLNPAVNISPTTTSYGNPDLGSARRTSAKLTYMLIKPKVNANLSVSYAFVNNGIAAVRFLDPEGIINSTYQNIGHRRDLGINGFVQWSPGANTRLMLNAGVEYQRATQQGMKLSRWTPRGYMQFSQKLPLAIWAEAAAYGWWGHLNDVYSYMHLGFMSGLNYSVTLRRAFLKQDRLNVSIAAGNFIGPSRTRYQTATVNGDYTAASSTSMRRRGTLMLTVSYRFGSLNAMVKKTARKIENDDLVGKRENNNN